MLDLTVASIPIYFGTMAAEHRYLRARAAEQGPGPADYTPQDTATSLAMGLGSLAVPLVLPKLVRHVVPGKGRYGKVLVGVAAAAAVATTVADRLVDRADRVADAEAQWAAGGADRDKGNGPLPWFVAIAGWDFLYYWNHRFMHEVRALWAIHVVHHSSERYNLSTALRQPVADVLGLWLPYGVMARFGIRPHVLTQARALNLLYQYWIHTEAIRTIGRAEAVLNTPSHHRVHHGSQRQYLDRNHGSILIVWDRLFGTFEREDERVVYGLTTNIDTYNPVKVATHEYRDIVRDVAGSTSWRDRLGFVLRGPGWAHERHRQLAAEGDAIVDDPDEATTAA